jgi:hypothetical protein
MRVRWNNVGLALAILAGLTTLAFTQWPIQPPQARGSEGALWGVGAWIIGLAFIASAFLAHTRPWLARAILVVGAVALLASGMTLGRTWQVWQMGALAALFDMLPAMLALMAAALIGSIEQTREERLARERGAMPDLPLSREQQAAQRAERAA